jgi:predicted amidohydrolase
MLKIAVVQYAPKLKAKEENLRRLAELVLTAAKAGAKLAILPELASTGYSFMSAEEAATMAEPIDVDGRTFRIMQTLAKKLDIHIVWGMAEEELSTGKLYNSQVLMTPTSQWVSYRKVNFFGNDWLWATEGRANPSILECDFGDGDTRKVGLLICRDVRDKKDDDKWTSFYEKGDADLICLSANWGRGAFPATSWMDFVRENNTTLAVSNRWGQEENNDFGEGGVCVIEPPSKVHCKGLIWSQDCIVYAEV